MPVNTEYDFDGTVGLVTGASGVLGSSVLKRLQAAGASVAATDVVAPDEADAHLDPSDVNHFFRGDLSEEAATKSVVDSVINEFGRLDHLVNIAGTWRGGTPIEETDVDTFDLVFDVNLKTMFLASKHAIPHLQETDGSIVSVSARASLEGGRGDGPYRAAKAGVRLLTETIAEENKGSIRANAIMPSVIDTPANREMMPDADHDSWVNPSDIADVIAFLLSDAAEPTSGAAVPVYGQA